MKIKILVATHIECVIPKSDILLPIHVGSSNSNLNLNIQRDDEGFNISSKNNQYCELTAIYWAYKNLKHQDFIGLAHYRRFPTFQKISIKYFMINSAKYYFYKYFYNSLIPGKNYVKWNSIISKIDNDLLKNLEESLLKNSKKYSMFVLKPVKFSNLNTRIYFNLTVPDFLIELTINVVNNKFPNIHPFLVETLSNNRLYPCNMFVFKNFIYEEYSLFIFTILGQVEENLEEKNIKAYPRTMGYIAEILTSSFISYKILNGEKVSFLNLLNVR